MENQNLCVCVCVCVQKAFQKYIKNHKRVLFAQGLLLRLLARETVTAGRRQLLVPAGCRPGSLNSLVTNTQLCDGLAKLRGENGKGPGSEEGKGKPGASL